MMTLEDYSDERQWAKVKDSFKGPMSDATSPAGAEIVFVDGYSPEQKQALHFGGTSNMPSMSQSTTYAGRTTSKK